MPRPRFSIKNSFIINKPNNFEKDEITSELSIKSYSEKECNTLMKNFADCINLNMSGSTCSYESSRINPVNNKWVGEVKVKLKSKNDFGVIKYIFKIWKKQIFSADFTPRVFELGKEDEVIEDIYNIAKLNKNDIIQNIDDNRYYEVLFVNDDYTILKCTQDNLIGIKEVVVTSEIEKGMRTQCIVWKKANYFENEEKAMIFLKKKEEKELYRYKFKNNYLNNNSKYSCFVGNLSYTIFHVASNNLSLFLFLLKVIY